MPSKAQPGKDGVHTVASGTQIVNRYCPITASVAVFDNTLTVLSSTLLGLCPGDLIMIFQAQGAVMDYTSNTAAYGTYTSGYNSVGAYEFQYVQNVNANIVTVQGVFQNNYYMPGYPQVIKVPQYTTLTINPGASIVTKPWQDTLVFGVRYRFGGVTAIHSNSIVNNGTITANGAGFRGGGVLFGSSAGMNITSYRSTNSSDGGEKGESLAGYGPEYDLMNGRYGRGAPANGGGGGNAHNAGGGGGANFSTINPPALVYTGTGEMIVNPANPLAAWALDPDYIANGNTLVTPGGGRGGYSFASFNSNALVFGPGNATWSGDNRRNLGGLGGRGYLSNWAFMFVLGGGGGAGSANNNVTTPGGNGGGTVYLITNGLSGSGLITANGNKGGSTIGCSCDGASGGGGGGNIYVRSPLTIPNTQTLTAIGGAGGDELNILPLFGNVYASTPDEADGPGGGGTGGVILHPFGQGPFPSDVSGGFGGTSLSPAVTEMISNGATAGSTGTLNPIAGYYPLFNPLNTAVSNAPICQGATLNFTSTPATSYTWTGPNSFSSLLQNPSIANSTPLMSGTYTVSFGYSGYCMIPYTYTLNVVVNPTPAISISTATSCIGSTTLFASGASAYTWNPGSVISSSLVVPPGPVTVYSVTGTSTAACTGSATITVSVPPPVTVNIAASSASICVGGSITLTATASGGVPGYNYTWTAGPLTNTYTVSQPAGNYAYTLTARDARNCSAVQTATTSFVALPVVSVSSTSVCAGETGTLSASGATSYTWSLPVVTGNPFTAAPAITTVYSVTGSAAGCTASANASIIVMPMPSLSFTTAAITCASLGSATVSGSGTPGPYTYTWNPTIQTGSAVGNLYPGTYTVYAFDGSSGCTYTSTTLFTPLVPFTGTVSSTATLACNGIPTGTAAIALSGGSGSQNYSWTDPAGIQTTSIAVNLSAVIHTITVIDNITFCTVTKTLQIAQPTPLVLNVTANPPLACVNSSIQLNAVTQGGTPGYTYSWTPGGNSPTFSVTQTSGGAYIYTVQSKDQNSCTVTNTVGLTFVDYPVVTTSNYTLCAGKQATLTASGAATYAWLPGNYAGSSYVSNSLNASTVFTVIGSNSGCSDTAMATVMINTLPVAVIGSSNPPCQGSILNLFGSGAGAGTYTWTGPAGFTSQLQNPSVNPLTLNHTGSYALAITDANGCKTSTSKLIAVLAQPFTSVTGMSVCVGEPAVLIASGGVSYSWSGPANFSSTSATVVIPVTNNTASGIYTVNIAGANSCIATQTAQLITYNYPLPVASISATTKACVNSSISLQGLGGSSYLWQGPGGFISSQQNPGFIAGPNSGGSYTLSVRNASNCGASATIPITIYALPEGKILSSADKSCVPLCANFSFSSSTHAGSIGSTLFSIDNVFLSDSGFHYCIQVAGKHSAKVFFTDTNGCSNTSTLALTAYIKPLADFEFSPASPVEGSEPVIFTNTSIGPDQTQWSWFFSNSEEDVKESKHGSWIYETAGSYPVAMVVTNAWGCSDTVVKYIHVATDFNLYVPNAFTPDGDQLNDVFQPKGVGITNYRLEIFDRWGALIFSSSDFFKGWDGTYKGQACKPDVYAWKISLKDPSAKNRTYSGHITLVR